MLTAISELTDAVTRLSAEGRALRIEQRREVRAIWATMVGGAVVVAVVIATAFTLTFNNSSRISENNQKICPILALAIPRPGDPPPTTDRARLYVERSLQLYKDYGCHAS